MMIGHDLRGNVGGTRASHSPVINRLVAMVASRFAVRVISRYAMLSLADVVLQRLAPPLWHIPMFVSIYIYGVAANFIQKKGPGPCYRSGAWIYSMRQQRYSSPTFRMVNRRLRRLPRAEILVRELITSSVLIAKESPISIATAFPFRFAGALCHRFKQPDGCGAPPPSNALLHGPGEMSISKIEAGRILFVRPRYGYVGL
jgi:hypothetical protein